MAAALAGGFLVYGGLASSFLAPAVLAWVLLLTALAVGGALRRDPAYWWLWAFVAWEAAFLGATAGQAALPHLAGTLLVGGAWLFGRTPRWVAGATAVAWAFVSLWQARGPLSYFNPAPQPLPGSPLHPDPLLLAALWALASLTLRWLPTPWAVSCVASLAHLGQTPWSLAPAALAGGLAIALAGTQGRRVAAGLAIVSTMVLTTLGLQIARFPPADPDAPPDSTAALDRWQQAALARMPEGSVQPSAALASAFPAGARRGTRVYRMAFPTLSTMRRRLCDPAWLAVSNNVESVTDAQYPPSGRVILFRSPVPARPGRVFLSHFNTSLQPRPLVLELRNPDRARSARLRWGRRGLFAQQRDSLEDPGAEAWRRYTRSPEGGSSDLPPGGSQRVRLEGLLGNGVAMVDLEPDRPVELTVAMGALPSGAMQDPALAPVGSQSRGVYPCPDEEVEGEVDLAAGRIRSYTFGEEWLTGLDASGPLRRDVLKGNYGAISHLRVRIRRPAGSEFRRLLVLLIPSGGFLGTAWEGDLRILHAHDGLVLLNREVPDGHEFRYDFSLAANAFAPAYVLFVPLRF